MIVWLASFPRSGNTMLRILLHRFYGRLSYSLYEEGAVDGTARENSFGTRAAAHPRAQES
jgi:hypothetical protein